MLNVIYQQFIIIIMKNQELEEIFQLIYEGKFRDSLNYLMSLNSYDQNLKILIQNLQKNYSNEEFQKTLIYIKTLIK